ncbi:MAG: GTPase Era [Acidobacteriota bacterium]|nr:MAG: GTPase Era [Acidobacteriota bacterium]
MTNPFEPDAGSSRFGYAALIGRANVGKSTLLNRLVGEKLAIISDVPQTTRHRILGVRHLPGGQIAFVDAPGFHRPQHQLGELLIERARAAAEECDVVLWVIDASAGLGPGDRFVFEHLRTAGSSRPVVLVPNKIDQMNKGKLLPLIEAGIEKWGCRAAVPVSAKTGENCDRLLETVLELLPVGRPMFPPDYLTDQQDRMLAAEIVREKLLERLRQEVPHAIAVQVERMGERDDGLLVIEALICVERQSQKKIVIGRGGALLKQVGTSARKELEQRFGRRLLLTLWVKVREDWRDRLASLRDLGVYPS